MLRAQQSLLVDVYMGVKVALVACLGIGSEAGQRRGDCGGEARCAASH